MTKDVCEVTGIRHESAIETAASVLREMSATSVEQGDKNKMDIIHDKLEKLDLMATHTAADIKSLRGNSRQGKFNGGGSTERFLTGQEGSEKRDC